MTICDKGGRNKIIEIDYKGLILKVKRSKPVLPGVDLFGELETTVFIFCQALAFHLSLFQ